MNSGEGGPRPEPPADKPPRAPQPKGLSGQKPGDRRVRVDRPKSEYFRYTPSGALEARPKAHEEKESRGRVFAAGRWLASSSA